MVECMAVPIQSVQRALSLLDHLAEKGFGGGTVSLREAALRLGLGVTTTHNLLKTLVYCGYARRLGEGMYGLGPVAEDLHRAAVAPRELVERGKGILYRLVGEFHESVVLAALFRGRRYTLARVSGDRELGVDGTDSDVGEIWSRVTGRVLAAFAQEEERERICSLNGMPTAWKGVRTAKALDGALAGIRKAGWAEQFSDDGHIWSAAVPVLTKDGCLLASLGAFMPAVRASAARAAGIRRAMAKCAAELGGMDTGRAPASDHEEKRN